MTLREKATYIFLGIFIGFVFGMAFVMFLLNKRLTNDWCDKIGYVAKSKVVVIDHECFLKDSDGKLIPTRKID